MQMLISVSALVDDTVFVHFLGPRHLVCVHDNDL